MQSAPLQPLAPAPAATTCTGVAAWLVLAVLAMLLVGALGAAQEQGRGRRGESDEERAARRARFEEAIRGAAVLGGFEYTDADVELMLPDVLERLRSFERLRAVELENAVPPALGFRPLGHAAFLGGGAAPPPSRLDVELPEVARPDDLRSLYFADVATLAALVQSRQVSCVELAELFLARLEEVDATLHCVITLTRERALAQAAALDRELAEGTWRGPLHGIPWGAKDLLAVEGYPTTWGAAPYRDQALADDAAVVRRLDEAGAVLVAKLSLGALAWGDVWFGGRTRNPWDPEEGSSGSSAGSASAVAAGAVPFALGSETLGSIVSPSERCGNSSLRPTFGRVSRTGAMALSWSMDKLGPLCRSAQDAAIVFAALHGADPADDTVDAPFRFPTGDERLTVGFLEQEAERDEAYAQVLQDLEALEGLEVELVPVTVPDFPAGDMTMVLQVEAAAAFDALTRSRGVDELVRQERYAWPNVFRHAQLVPATEYVRANRLRTLLMRAWDETMRDVDVLVHPSFAAGILQATNLTGHPTFVAPAGFREDGTPHGVSFTGRPFEDDRVLTLAARWQARTDHHRRHPDL